jgi:hypothetical protein
MASPIIEKIGRNLWDRKIAMTQHISESELNYLRSGLLPARETIHFAEHLEMCRECSIRLAMLRGGRTNRFSLSTFLGGRHLEYESISDYLDDRLNVSDRKLIEIHLQLCRICHDDVKSLKEFRESSGSEPEIKQSIQEYLKRIFVEKRRMRILNMLPAYNALLILISLVLGMLLLISRDLSKRQPISSGRTETPHPSKTETPPHDHVALPSVSANIADPPKAVKEVRLADAIIDRGRKYGLDERGNTRGLGYLPEDIREDMADVLRGKPINRASALDDLADTVTYLRGNIEGKRDISLIEPVGTLIIQDRPLLKWKVLKDATSYVVDIVDESFNPIAQSRNLSSPEWAVDVTLERDAVYLWQVSAFRNEERIEFDRNRIGKFRVISVEKLNQVEIARKRYSSHLALAVFYVKAGLLDDARSELKKLISRNPQSKLLKRIYRREMSGRQ